jgi:hypothetical protein
VNHHAVVCANPLAIGSANARSLDFRAAYQFGSFSFSEINIPQRRHRAGAFPFWFKYLTRHVRHCSTGNHPMPAALNLGSDTRSDS